jgi:toxin CptA
MTAVWLVVILCVGLMGFAIQRGGTCMVAAVDEVLSQRRAHRLTAMLEASLWVVGGLALAQLARWMGSMPGGYDITRWTVVGGVLLGLGAWINGACVFGAIARLGSGQWAQALTPLGFYVGSLSVGVIFQPQAPHPSTAASAWPWWSGASWLAPMFVLYALWRVGPSLLEHWRQRHRVKQLAQRVWAPHSATIVIGITFVLTLLLAGPWAYTDVLARLAQDMHTGDWQALTLPLLLLLALYAGALIGGSTAGRWRPARPSLSDGLHAFAGGALMGCGSLLIPGSNDGLIFIGIPLLRPYAWLALASMVLAIAGALLLQRAWLARRAVAS